MLLDRLFHRNMNGHHSTAKRWAVAAGAAGTAVAARAGLPSLFTQVANFALQKIPGYRGHLEHIELHLFKGRIALRELVLNQTVDHHDAALFRVESVEAQISWRHLMKGLLVGDIEIDRPSVLIDLDQQKKKQIASTPSSSSPPQENSIPWQQKIRQMMPFQINVSIFHGEAYLRGLPGQDGANVRARDINIQIKNVTNSKKLSGTMMAFVECHMRVMSRGYLTLQASGYPLAAPPVFNLDFKLEDLDLSELKPIVRHFTGLDLKQGILEAYAEAAAKEGHLQGYIKPVLDRLVVDRAGPGMVNAAKGKLADGFVKLLQNKKEERIATRIDIDGPLDKPDIDAWGAVVGILKNAFLKAWTADLEHKLWFEHAGKEASENAIHSEVLVISSLRRFLGRIRDALGRRL